MAGTLKLHVVPDSQTNLSQQLRERLHSLHSQTLHEMIKLCPDGTLPFSRTRCNQLVRYQDRSEEPDSPFQQMVTALLTNLTLAQILNCILQYQGYAGYFVEIIEDGRTALPPR